MSLTRPRRKRTKRIENEECETMLKLVVVTILRPMERKQSEDDREPGVFLNATINNKIEIQYYQTLCYARSLTICYSSSSTYFLLVRLLLGWRRI